MPLTKNQKRMIIASISHLLDFPKDAGENNLAEIGLIEAFTEQAHAHNQHDQDTYLSLRDCVEHPEKYFQRLEITTDPITIGEIQQYLLDLIVHRLKTTLPEDTAVDETETQLAEGIVNPFHQGKGKIFAEALQAKPEWSMPFVAVSVSPDTEEDNIYQLPGLEEAIYKAKIKFKKAIERRPDEIGEMVREVIFYPILFVKVTLAPTYIRRLKIYFNQPILTEEDHEKLIKTAKDAAREYAADLALSYLAKQGILSFDIYQQHYVDAIPEEEQGQPDSTTSETNAVSSNQPYHSDYDTSESDEAESSSSEDDEWYLATFFLVTHQYYFSQLQLKKLLLADFKKVSIQMAKKYLTHPAIIKLLQDPKCNIHFHDLSVLSLDHLDRLTHPNLFQLFSEKILFLIYVCLMGDNDYSILIHPVYQQLLLHKKINISDIWQISNDRKAILVIPFIANLIRQEKIRFSDGLKLPIALKTIFLQHRYAEYFYKNYHLLLPLCSFSLSKCQLLKGIMELVIEDHIQIEQIARYKDSTVEAVLFNPRLLQWLREKWILWKEIEKLNSSVALHDFYAKVFSKKLFKLMSHSAHFDNGHTITKKIDLLMNEFSFVTQDFRKVETDLKQYVLYHCALLIEKKIKKIRIKYLNSGDLLNLTDKILRCILMTKVSTHQDWINALRTIMSHSHELISILARLKHTDLSRSDLTISDKKEHTELSFVFFKQDQKPKNNVDTLQVFFSNFAQFHELIGCTPEKYDVKSFT